MARISKILGFCAIAVLLLLSAPARSAQPAKDEQENKKELFQTSDRCFACHNGLSTSSGEDIPRSLSFLFSRNRTAGVHEIVARAV